MKTSIIRWIAGLIILGLLGVLFIQAYWISNAIRVQGAAFDRAVAEALVSASNRIELEEDRQLVASSDIRKEIFTDSTQKYRIVYHLDSTKGNVKKASTSTFISHDNFPKGNTERIILRKTDSLNFDLETSLQRLSDRKERINSIIEEMIISITLQPPAWEERLDKVLIQKFLLEEFHFKGLPEEFHYAVFSPEDSLAAVIQSEGFKKGESGMYQVPVFKHIPGREPAVLQLFFPSKKSFVLGEIWLLIAISMLFSIILILAAAAAIITLFRQKKLHQIRADLISNVSHEFRTPLASIGLASTALENRKVEASPEMQSYYISVIRKENERMQEKVDQLIQAALAERDQINIQLQEVAIAPLLRESMDAMAMQIASRQGQIRVEVQEDQLLCIASKEHLSNAILNILDNAIKYCKVAPDVRVRISQENEWITISISDNGPGMDNKTLQQVFERFFRAGQGNIHNVKGFGLGLSYVKAVMTAMDGHIEVQSEEGKGSTFTLFLKKAHSLAK